MTTQNKPRHYGYPIILMHWFMVLIFIMVIGTAWIFDELPNGDLKLDLMFAHKSFGLFILMLATLRMVIKAFSTSPLGFGNQWEQKAAKTGHYALYGVMIMLPVSGIVMSWAGGYSVSLFGFFELSSPFSHSEWLQSAGEEVHEFLANTLYLLLGVHLVAVLYHQIIKGEPVMKRMSLFNSKH